MMEPLTTAQIIVCAFFAILFLQSGLDKVLDRKGNLEWMTPHFAKSPFRNAVGLALSVLTLVEIAAGALSAVSIVVLARGTEGAWIPRWTMIVVCAALLMLFAGQRLAKDYAGAAGLVPYFGVGVLGYLLVHWEILSK